ncbi:hypothetical protein R5R35_009156 [Gryllus longicercus]|uniref:Protein kinase domain-containing protein n=1 Tax=Gryllus longicercus TaxID=2509291 RepID=A0AAN9VIX9_9ORTH
MLDASASMTQITLRPLPHVKVSDTAEMQTKFYRFEGLLGRGTFGTVMKATELKSGTKWAIKVINKAQSGASRIKLFQREISILRAVHHPHIIHLERVFESPKTLFLVFELCLGELREVFLKKKVFTEDETRKVVASLASAVSYLHRNDIVHRDLKLENILVSTNPSDPEDNLFIKVTDFGLSVVRGGVGHESMLQEMCGTPAYMSPELFGERMYSQQCDVWAMGVIMYLLLTGRYPFEAHSGRSLAQVVVGCEPNFNCEPFTTPAELAKEAEQKVALHDVSYLV